MTVFTADFCEGVVIRQAKCALAHVAEPLTAFEASHVCSGSLASVVPRLCSGRPWRSMLSSLVSGLPAEVLAAESKPVLLQRAFRAVEVVSQTSYPGGPACQDSVPGLKMSSHNPPKLLTTACPEPGSGGLQCVPAGYSVTVHGVTYYEVAAAPGFTGIAPDTCTLDEDYDYDDDD